MTNPMPTNDKEAGQYRSGVAARLAGIQVDTLRVWERRYDVVAPAKSAGRQRLYSSTDVRRLRLIKQLVDAGHPIGDLAALSFDALLAVRTLAASVESPQGELNPYLNERPVSVALVGGVLASESMLREFSGGSFEVLSALSDPSTAASALAQVKADVVIIELPTIRDTDVELVGSLKAACAASCVVILYRFARTALVQRLRTSGYTVARGTMELQEIEAICRRVMGVGARKVDRPALAAADAERPPARFDEQTLAALASASRAVECECPRHLVDLVISLGGFERYSGECAASSPTDLVLHLELQRAAGLARSIVERALERVAIYEGLMPSGIRTR